ncbi:hypothetical protein [uncultured Microbacterium sp.]|uniref:hypothetical protein n=1 Tax=uncultured Microbacterium sp. TaxID=191216 RepID=UPI00261BB861|nr:hypothetical protein [uncultured Microbacterium sp.]
MAAIARRRGNEVLFSPHNLFARYGGARAQRHIENACRAASTVVVYNEPDTRFLDQRGIEWRELPLVQYAPVPDEAVMDYWRRFARDQTVQVCAIGQIRADKNYSLLIKACADAGLGLLIAGESVGEEASKLRGEIVKGQNVHIIDSYIDLDTLVAIACCVGTVALPYEVASQSGVAALLARYGLQIVVADIGGLAAQGTRVVGAQTAAAWGQALVESARLAVRTRNEPLPTDAHTYETYNALILESWARL